MAGIDSIGGIGGGGDIEEFKKLQTARVDEARTQAAQPQPAGDAGAAQSVGQAQGGQTQQQYPQL